MRANALICLAISAAAAGCAGPSYRSWAPAADHHAGLTCAPFARALSGIALYGDAADWWPAAQDRYARGSQPHVGAALVFRRSDRLPSGHVSVVSRVLARRQILVIHANWTPGDLDQDQLVVDVSQDNDWTLVRVWWPPVGQLGVHEYATYGFILPTAPASHDALVSAAPGAVRTALWN